MNKKRVSAILKKIEKLFKDEDEFDFVEYSYQECDYDIFKLSFFTGEKRSLKEDFDIIDECDTYDASFDYEIGISKNTKLRDITYDYIKGILNDYESFLLGCEFELAPLPN